VLSPVLDHLGRRSRHVGRFGARRGTRAAAPPGDDGPRRGTELSPSLRPVPSFDARLALRSEPLAQDERM